ncbi:T-lymphoma invasion and metastasis-inducing protein 1 [Mycolicibacterium brisbanense]|uniref:T-lymphoma invasion and metastasis-inducing protein 1 n=1 Tax=Mycolicibacterium brisbanense TaxID=146020 RepID=A0A100VYF6_9MYCO|nr:T-lymphoma invasion and metastasis-inducing protein 1 [Mycolicibacterium brisbanense]
MVTLIPPVRERADGKSTSGLLVKKFATQPDNGDLRRMLPARLIQYDTNRAPIYDVEGPDDVGQTPWGACPAAVVAGVPAAFQRVAAVVAC